MLLSVWNLSDFWKSVERASIYLMMFLAFATLIMPVLDEPVGAQIGIGGGLLIATVGALIGVGGTMYVTRLGDCNNRCSVKVQDPDKHWTSCGRCHAGVYVCPNERHPHETVCGRCNDIYWDCPSSSQAYDHGTL